MSPTTELPDPYGGPEHEPFQLGSSARRAVLVHGFPGTPSEMRSVGAHLAGLGWEVRAPLLPGFGSDIVQLGEQRAEDWLAAVREVFAEAAEGAEATALVGFSMGGALALTAASELEPERLALIAPFSGSTDPRTVLLPLLRFVMPTLKPFKDADLEAPEARRELGKIFPGADLDDPGLRERIRERVALPTEALHQVMRVGRMARGAAPRCAAPCLVVQGVDDATVAPSRTRALVARLGGRVRFREVAGGHDLTLPGRDGHAELLAELSAFLA